jgi:hypothetical protein
MHKLLYGHSVGIIAFNDNSFTISSLKATKMKSLLKSITVIVGLTVMATAAYAANINDVQTAALNSSEVFGGVALLIFLLVFPTFKNSNK